MQIEQTVFVWVTALSLVTGCAGTGRIQVDARTEDAKPTAAPDPDGASSAPVVTTPFLAGQLIDPLRGKVVETMDSGGYTYVLVATDRGEVWAAARSFPVAVRDDVELAGLQPMQDFRSQTLGRVFEEIQFVGLARVVREGDPANSLQAQTPTPQLPPGHPPLASGAHPRSNPLAGPEAGRIPKLADGVTVAELFVNKADFAGTTVRFRGQVIKASRRILGSNWLHIRDGTGESGSNDITVTSKNDFAAVGSIVVVEGTLDVDKDFGAGYSYDVIVENATVIPDPGYLDRKGKAP